MKNKQRKITDDMTLEEKEQLLDRKKRILKRWAIVIGLLALVAMGFLGMTLLDRVLTGAPGGGLEINYNKIDEKVAWLGSEIQDITASISDALKLTSTDGVLVSSVTPGSPADQAGLERGDVILAINETEVADTFQIQNQLREFQPGDTVRIFVDKIDGGKRNVYATLGVKQNDTTSSSTNIKKVAGITDIPVNPVLPTPWGISVAALTSELREQFNIPAAEQGVAVVAVVKDSLADSQGIDVGDVIASINQIPTPNLPALYQALEDNESVLMDVYSPDDAKRIFVSLPDEGDSPPMVMLMSFDQTAPKTNRIVIPCDSDNLDGQVYYRFASAPFFILYDIGKNEMTIIRNPYAAQVRGMGIIVAQMLIQQNIDAVVVGGIGPQSYDTFYLAKVKVYGPVTGSVRNAIADYQAEKLVALKEANLGGYGNSSTATIPTGGSPWTEEDADDEEEGGYEGQPTTIPPKGKPGSADVALTATGDARANRPETCVCPNCGAEVTHPASTSCADMVCPICGSQLMTASPGSDTSIAADVLSQLPVPVTIQRVAGTPSRIAAIPVANDIWALSNQPSNMPPIQQTAAISTQVSVCICPLDGTTVTHPVGVPCAALQCPVCGGRMVSSSSAVVSANNTIPTAGIQTGGKPDDVGPVQQTFYLVPITSKPDNIPPTPLGQGVQVVALVPTAGGPPTDTGMAPSDTGAVVDGSPQAGAGTAQGGRSTLCICPNCKTTVTHPIGIPCASLTCPICGSRLVNADPGGTAGGGVVPTAGMPTGGMPTGGMPTGGIQTGGKPDDVGPMQQTFYLVPISSKPEDIPPLGQTVQGPLTPTAGPLVALIPTAGGPPTDIGMGSPSDAGPSVDGQDQGGGQAGSGAAQSGRSTLCICPMCKTTVTHPIGVPCVSLNCPVCGSRLVNAEPGGASGGAALTAITPTAGMTVAQTANMVAVSASSRKVVIPSTGKSLKSELAPLLDDARYFVMFSLGKYEVMSNPYYRDKRASGAEIAQFIVSEGGAVVICNNISAVALKSLKDLKVKVYPGFTGTVQQVIDIYADGRLKDSGTVTGIVVDDDEKSEHEGGGGPPSSKSKTKEKKEEAEVF